MNSKNLFVSDTAKRSTVKRVWSVFGILCISAIAELLTNVVLVRSLTAEVFGKFKFINAALLFIVTLCLFGQNIGLIRGLGNDAQKFDWKGFIRLRVFAGMSLGVLAVIIVGYFYHFDIFEVVLICVLLFVALLSEYYFSLMRACGSYNRSMLVNKATAVVLCLLVCVVVFVNRHIGVHGLLVVYVIAIALALWLAFKSTAPISNGLQPLPRGVFKDGVLLFFITASFVLITQMDQFFISKVLGYGELARYAVIAIVTRGFELAALAIWFVLMPHYSQGVDRCIKNDSIKVLVVALVMAGLYAVFGFFLLHFLFGGKFDSSAYLLKYFIISGIFRVLYSIPSGVIDGKMPAKYLKLFLCTCVLGIIINFVGNWVLIPLWGMTGSAVSTMVSWIFRVVTGYWVVVLSVKAMKKQTSVACPQ
jgi:O-antigen/teichoic acid export membrane protein